MKKIGLLAVVMLAVLAVLFSACDSGETGQNTPPLRFHIRANSNSESDQAVKLLCRDAVVAYLQDELYALTSIEQAKRELKKRLGRIEEICNEILTQGGFLYRATARIDNEFFPTRSYENVVLESGYYDALIVGLGSAKGDNWWCVIYPPLCYLEAQSGGGVRYKSKIVELWNEWFGGGDSA